MDVNEKTQFVREMMNRVTEDLLKKVPELPSDWDGIEVRWWISDYLLCNYTAGVSNRVKRHREYRNTIIVHNLI